MAREHSAALLQKEPWPSSLHVPRCYTKLLRATLLRLSRASRRGGAKDKSSLPFNRLPFHCCALSFTPFGAAANLSSEPPVQRLRSALAPCDCDALQTPVAPLSAEDPVCTEEGYVFEARHLPSLLHTLSSRLQSDSASQHLPRRCADLSALHRVPIIFRPGSPADREHRPLHPEVPQAPGDGGPARAEAAHQAQFPQVRPAGGRPSRTRGAAVGRGRPQGLLTRSGCGGVMCVVVVVERLRRPDVTGRLRFALLGALPRRNNDGEYHCPVLNKARSSPRLPWRFTRRHQSHRGML